jgi:hypothetical protein
VALVGKDLQQAAVVDVESERARGRVQICAVDKKRNTFLGVEPHVNKSLQNHFLNIGQYARRLFMER